MGTGRCGEAFEEVAKLAPDISVKNKYFISAKNLFYGTKLS